MEHYWPLVLVLVLVLVLLLVLLLQPSLNDERQMDVVRQEVLESEIAFWLGDMVRKFGRA